MARIRTIKPEFFTSPDTAKASIEARLFYIALWCWADDWGIGEANMNALLGFAFPEDDEKTRKEIQSLCKEVANTYGTLFYENNGRYFYAIPTWEDHQRTQRRAQRRNPTPDDPESQPDKRIHEKHAPSVFTQGTSESTQGNDQEGTGEREQGKGNRGTYISNPPEQETITLINPAPSADASDRFDEFWEAYPKRTGQNPKKPARQKFQKVIKDVDPQKLIDAAQAYGRSEKGNNPKFIAQTITWLNQERWNDEYSEPEPQPFDPWNTRNLTASQRRLQEGYEREQRILNGELSFDNPDNPYLQPRQPRQAIEGGSSWTNKQQ